MAYRPKTDVYDDGPRKQATYRSKLVQDGIHLRTGKPVREGTVSHFIEVTEADTKRAVIGDPRKCGFSQAARRIIHGLIDVEFYTSVAYLIFRDYVERYTINGGTQRALVAFDFTGVFRPGFYWLSAPPPSHRLRKSPGAKPRVKGGENTARRTSSTGSSGADEVTRSSMTTRDGAGDRTSAPRQASSSRKRSSRKTPDVAAATTSQRHPAMVTGVPSVGRIIRQIGNGA